MALTMSAMRKQLVPQLNKLFDTEYKKYQHRYADPVKPEPKQNAFRGVDTDVLRNLWLTKFGDTPPTVQEVADLHDTDIYHVGAILYSRGELRSTNTQNSFDEVYLLKPHANS